MKNTVHKLLILAIGCLLGSSLLNAAAFEKVPPVVIKTSPAVGALDVQPGVVVISITFSKEMMEDYKIDNAFGAPGDVEVVGKPSWDAEHRTFIISIRTVPKKAYGFWVNTEERRIFKDKNGNKALPYMIYFKTKAE